MARSKTTSTAPQGWHIAEGKELQQVMKRLIGSGKLVLVKYREGSKASPKHCFMDVIVRTPAKR